MVERNSSAAAAGLWRGCCGAARTWGAYVYAGDFAVYASDADRDLVAQVLDSARSGR